MGLSFANTVDRTAATGRWHDRRWPGPAPTAAKCTQCNPAPRTPSSPDVWWCVGTLRAIWTRSSAGSVQGPARCPARPAYRRSSNLQHARLVSCAHSAPRSLAQRAAHRRRLHRSAGSPPWRAGLQPCMPASACSLAHVPQGTAAPRPRGRRAAALGGRAGGPTSQQDRCWAASQVLVVCCRHGFLGDVSD